MVPELTKSWHAVPPPNHVSAGVRRTWRPNFFVNLVEGGVETQEPGCTN